MSDEIVGALLAPMPIVGLRPDTVFIKVCVSVQVDGRIPDEILLLHLNQISTQYESNIVTFDTSNGRDYWRNAAGAISATRGFAIAYLGFGSLPMQGAADVIAEMTIGIEKFKPRLATGTSYTDTQKLEGQQHSRRYLSQIGGYCHNVIEPVTGVSFSTLNNTPARIISLRAFAL